MDWNLLPVMSFSFVWMFFTVGYYIFVPSMLWLIWKKVRHLPG